MLTSFDSDFPLIQIKRTAISIQKQFKLQRLPGAGNLRALARYAANGCGQYSMNAQIQRDGARRREPPVRAGRLVNAKE